jgi:hypothetical protein
VGHRRMRVEYVHVCPCHDRRAVLEFHQPDKPVFCYYGGIIVPRGEYPGKHPAPSHCYLHLSHSLPFVKICFTGDNSLRAMSVMVLFLVFLQKGSFVSYLGSTVVKAVFRQSRDHKELVKRLITGEEEEGVFQIKTLGEESESD